MTPSSHTGPLRAVPVQPAYVRQRATDLVARSGDAGPRVLLLRAAPSWSGEKVLEVQGRRVHVVVGISQLAVLDAYAAAPPEDYLVVLTNRHEEDLGDAVTLPALHQRVEAVDEWASVPALFPGAREVARELRRRGDWVPTALLDHQPVDGWGVSPTPTLTSRVALGALLSHLLGLAVTIELDTAVVMSALDRREARQSWAGVESRLREKVQDWAGNALGSEARVMLAVAGRGRDVSPIAVGLVLDVLWPGLGNHHLDESQVLARGRMVEYLGAGPIEPLVAQAFAESAGSVLGRLDRDGDDVQSIRRQAESMLEGIDWSQGAERSATLRAGLEARIRRLAVALDGTDAVAVERELRDVTAHDLATAEDRGALAARMAVRLWRWLAQASTATATANGPEAGPGDRTLASALQGYVDDGAWVDRAVAAVAGGSADPEVAAGYARLLARVAPLRRQDDRRAAELLVAHGTTPAHGSALVPVEDLLDRVLRPWITGAQGRALLVVLDGMAMASATEIAQEVTRDLGLEEWVPEGGRRLPGLAVLPTLTEFSRTSLLAGELTSGGLQDEKRAFAKQTAGVAFHKSDLRSEAGSRLAHGVREAIVSGPKAVAVVINTIDDALHKQDISSARWTLDRLEPLRELLAAAVVAGRTVILTADHGHVVERGSEVVTGVGGDGRWRPVAGGPVGDSEVLVRGERVLAAGNEAVLLWREDAHYGKRQSGYHGGAALAEMTVPIVVLRRPGLSAVAGWRAAAPQNPAWWNEPATGSLELAGATPVDKAKRKRPTKGQVDLALGDALFEVPAMAAPAASSPVEALMASEVYGSQRARAGRAALDDTTVTTMVGALLDRGGRAHHETVAGAAGIAVQRFAPTFTALRRLLNVDGYEVVRMDPDGVTVVLDVPLLGEQFGVSLT